MKRRAPTPTLSWFELGELERLHPRPRIDELGRYVFDYQTVAELRDGIQKLALAVRDLVDEREELLSGKTSA